MYRKGQAADSSVLSHPMLWLDERIFGKSHCFPAQVSSNPSFVGWSRSAVKGPSAWNAKYARSDGETEPGSPHMSDGEELGDEDVDYDDVRLYFTTLRLLYLTLRSRYWLSSTAKNFETEAATAVEATPPAVAGRTRTGKAKASSAPMDPTHRSINFQKPCSPRNRTPPSRAFTSVNRAREDILVGRVWRVMSRWSIYEMLRVVGAGLLTR